MAYKIVFKQSAKKELTKLDKHTYSRLRTAIGKLAQNPRPRQSRKLVGGVSLWRLRVGDYRVIYGIQDKELVILIVRVRHRGKVYK